MRPLSYSTVRKVWSAFNDAIFDGQLKMPKFFICSRPDREDLGWIWATPGKDKIDGIALNCYQIGSDENCWKSVLLHEMHHQFEHEVAGWDIQRENTHENFSWYQKVLDLEGYTFNIIG